MLETIPAAEGSAYHAYQLSAKGRALFPLIISLRQWGEEYLFSAGETHSLLQDSRNGEPLEKLQVRNRRGEVLEPAQSVRIRVVKWPAPASPGAGTLYLSRSMTAEKFVCSSACKVALNQFPCTLW